MYVAGITVAAGLIGFILAAATGNTDATALLGNGSIAAVLAGSIAIVVRYFAVGKIVARDTKKVEEKLLEVIASYQLLLQESHNREAGYLRLLGDPRHKAKLDRRQEERE